MSLEGYAVEARTKEGRSTLRVRRKERLRVKKRWYEDYQAEGEDTGNDKKKDEEKYEKRDKKEDTTRG